MRGCLAETILLFLTLLLSLTALLFWIKKDSDCVCDAASLVYASVSVSSKFIGLTTEPFISDVKKLHPKSETKRYSEIFRDFDNLELSITSW